MTKPNPLLPHVVAVGDITTGFTLRGPFPNLKAADDWLDNQMTEVDPQRWFILPVQPPVDPDQTEIQLLQETLKLLAALGIAGSLEYPGFLQIQTKVGPTLYFGFTNGPFGWNTNDEPPSGGESRFNASSCPEDLALYVEQILASFDGRPGDGDPYQTRFNGLVEALNVKPSLSNQQ